MLKLERTVAIGLFGIFLFAGTGCSLVNNRRSSAPARSRAGIPRLAKSAASAPETAGFDRTYYPGQSADHQTGQVHNGLEWEADVSMPSEAFLSYGPYASDIPAGRTNVTFRLAVDNVDADSIVILSLDIFDSSRNQILAQRDIQRTEFNAPMVAQDFTLSYESTPGDVMEFRVFYHGRVQAIHLSTRVTGSAVASAGGDLMSALWNGQAQFRYVRSLNWPMNENSGWTAVKDGVWYLFNREEKLPNRPASCDGVDHARTVVRMSSDQGRTWSDRQIVAEPVEGDPNSGCAVLDGASYFDSDTGTWHLLAQCLGTEKAWKLCHYTRQSPSPMGAFTPDPVNPAVAPGELWRRICSGEGKSCPGSVIDEGTPEILYKKNGYFFVTFHGYDPVPRTGYRGVARTRDFHTWLTDGDGLPGNAMFGAQDCQSWNPGCIGSGEATTLLSGGYHYMLIETPDLSLACTENQNWVFGLVRARGLASSGGWEGFPVNPLLSPSSRRACGLQYARFIQDQGRVFMMYEDTEKGRRLFELLPGSGAPLVE